LSVALRSMIAAVHTEMFISTSIAELEILMCLLLVC